MLNLSSPFAYASSLPSLSFGPSGARVLIGGVLCTELAHVKSSEHTKLTCKLPAGSGLSKTVIVYQESGDASSDSVFLSYKLCDPVWRDSIRRRLRDVVFSSLFGC
mgnify:CR=1 FL=1